jgi:tetratricopeptide (TPR) repeat protein
LLGRAAIRGRSRAGSDAAEGLAIARQLGDRLVLAYALNAAGLVARGEMKLDAAEAALSEALDLCRQVDEELLAMHTFTNLSSIAIQRGEHDKAMRLAMEGIEIIRKRDDRFALRPALLTLMRLAHLVGDEERGLATAREVVRMCANQGSPVTAAHALDGLAWVAARQGSPTRAARLLGAAYGLKRAAGFADRPEHLPLLHDAEARTQAALGAGELAVARAEGEAMTLEQAAAYALEESGPG